MGISFELYHARVGTFSQTRKDSARKLSTLMFLHCCVIMCIRFLLLVSFPVAVAGDVEMKPGPSTTMRELKQELDDLKSVVNQL